MERKLICVLANSVKQHERCVAGFEVHRTTCGKFELGPWIRPVSERDQGAVNARERALCNVGGDKEPAIGAIVEIGVKRHADDPVQPENWILDPSVRWRRLGTEPWSAIEAKKDRPEDVWLEDLVRFDRLTPQYIQRQKQVQSLYLIEPQTVRVEVKTETPRPLEHSEKKIRRVVFTYNNFEYILPLTDPTMEQTTWFIS